MTTSRAHLDVAAGGAYLDLTIAKATALFEKMVSNQGWNKECSQPRTKGGMRTVKETDMLAAKLDLLLEIDFLCPPTNLIWKPICSLYWSCS